MRAHASEERYRLISRVTSDYTFSTKLDEDGKMKLNWVAGAFEQMTGYTYEEYAALGGWRARLHPDDRKKDEQDLAQLQNNQPVVSEVRTYTKSGDLRWVRISAHPIWDERRNRLAGIVGGVKDITQEKQAQETLNKILLQQAAILNNIPHMAWLKDRDSRYIAVNNSFAKTSGFTPEQISGKTDFDIWRKEFARKYREDDLEVMATKQMRIVEEIQMDSAGNEYWVETIKTPILDENGEAIGTTGIARNISDRKLAESEREKLIRDLEAKNAELERFTYTVSHDLKSPLVTIAGFIGYLEKDLRSNDSEKALHNITRIRQAVEKIQALLNDLLELSRVGRLINPPQEIPFKEIVNEAVEMLAGAIASKGIKLQVQDEFPIVSGDRIRLLEVMQNLLENAVKFMGSQAHPLIQIGTRGLMHDMPVIFVRDNGIGILPEYHEKIFGLFNKLDPDSEGTGIGLALVRRIIEIHGGQIWVESEGFETGATFCFTLPASPRKG
jgi:PAS domain S-box-containing protein